MSLYKTKAIILRTNRYSEADKIINLLTPNGRVSAIAKGARKVKSKFGGRIELFCFLDLVLYKGKNLHTVTQANLLKPYDNIRNDYKKFLTASAAAELIDKVTFGGQKEQALFDLLERFLSYLDSVKQLDKIALLYFDWKVIRLLGVLPQTIHMDDQNEITWLNFSDGCLQDKPSQNDDCLKLEPLTTRLLKSIINNSSFKKVNAISISENTIEQISRLTEQYIKYQLQVNLRTRSYIV